jgi:hypothetical protein
MTHRSRYSATLQHELKVRELSGVQKVVNLSLGLATAAAVAVVGALSFAIIPH